MKVTIDTDNKTINVQESVNVLDLFTWLKTIENWEDYKVEVQVATVVNYNPLPVNRWWDPPTPLQPYWEYPGTTGPLRFGEPWCSTTGGAQY